MRFATLDLTLRDRALFTLAPSVAPITLPYIPGTAIRGLLAGQCDRDPALRSELIANESVWTAPAFPVLRLATGSAIAAVIPQSWVKDDDAELVLDGRDLAALRQCGEGWTNLSGLYVLERADADGEKVRPVTVPTETETRLNRVRANPGADGSGPFSQTVLQPGFVFQSSLWFDTDDDAEAADLLEKVRNCLSAGSLRLGASADGAFGGDVSIQIGRITTVERPIPRSTLAGERVDLVLPSPAIVRRSDGEPDPSALGDTVVELINNVLAESGSATLADGFPPALTPTRIGGFNRLHHGYRHEVWGADQGSVVTVQVDVPVDRSTWAKILSHRIGERVADGFGILYQAPNVAGLSYGLQVAPVPDPNPVKFTDGTPILDDGESGEDTAWLRDRLFSDALTEYLADFAALLTLTAENAPTRTALARLGEYLQAGRSRMKGTLQTDGSRWESLSACTIADYTRQRTRVSLRSIIDAWLADGVPAATELNDRHLGADAETFLGSITASLAQRSLRSGGADAQADAEAWLTDNSRAAADILLANLFKSLRRRSQEGAA